MMVTDEEAKKAAEVLGEYCKHIRSQVLYGVCQFATYRPSGDKCDCVGILVCGK